MNQPPKILKPLIITFISLLKQQLQVLKAINNDYAHIQNEFLIYMYTCTH